MSELDNLDYKPYVERYRQLLGVDTEEAISRADKMAQRDHSLAVFERLQDAAISVIDLSQSLEREQSQYYLRYGAGRRLLMMWRAYRSAVLTAHPERTEPLSEDEQTVMSREINVIYMHLRGTLDNFAWTIAFEKYPKMKLNPKSVGLFTPTIEPMLKSLGIYDEIYVYKDWNREVAERRDPVAHRIPLYVPGTMLTAMEGKFRAQLHAEWLAVAGTLNTANYDAVQPRMEGLWDRMNSIGTFLPYFVHHPEEPLIPIYPTLPNDMACLVKIWGIVRRTLAPPSPP